MMTIGMSRSRFTQLITIKMKDGKQYLLPRFKVRDFFGSDIYYRKTVELIKTYKERRIPEQEINEINGNQDIKAKNEWSNGLKSQWKETRNYLKKPRLFDNPSKKLSLEDSQEGYNSVAPHRIFHPDPFIPNIPIVTSLSGIAIFLLSFMAVLLFLGDLFKFIDSSSPVLPMILMFLGNIGVILVINFCLGLIIYYIRFFKKQQRFISIGSEGLIFKLRKEPICFYINWNSITEISDIKLESVQYDLLREDQKNIVIT